MVIEEYGSGSMPSLPPAMATGDGGEGSSTVAATAAKGTGDDGEGSSTVTAATAKGTGDDGEESGTMVGVPTGVKKRWRHELVPELRFPPGYHFLPTDEELVDVYLRAKIEGRAPPLDVIKEVKILNFEPDVLLGNYRPYGERRWYFFTRREKSGTNKLKDPRRQLHTDGGEIKRSWKATGSVATILRRRGGATGDEQAVPVGTKRILIYNSNVEGEDKWSMNEYVLRDYPELDQWILCTIQAKLRLDTKSKGAKKQKKGGEKNANTKTKTTKRRKNTAASSQAHEETTNAFDDVLETAASSQVHKESTDAFNNVLKTDVSSQAHEKTMDVFGDALKTTASSQAHKETPETFDDVLPLLMLEQDPHHQALHEDYPLALDNNNTSSIVEHPVIAEDIYQTLHGDHYRLENLSFIQQPVTYDMSNNLQTTTVVTHHHHHHSDACHLTRYQPQELVTFNYQPWQLQQHAEMSCYNDQVEMQLFIENVVAGSLIGQKHQETSPDSVLANGYSSTIEHQSNLGEQQTLVSTGNLSGGVAGDYRASFTETNIGTVALREVTSDQPGWSMCPHGFEFEWWGTNTCHICVRTC